jgi:hypothetical protein
MGEVYGGGSMAAARRGGNNRTGLAVFAADCDLIAGNAGSKS